MDPAFRRSRPASGRMLRRMDNEQLWHEVDLYIHDRLIGADPALEAALEESDRAGLPQIAVSAAQGKMLHLLAKAIGAARILEIGTLGGYSTIWLARALPEHGKLISLEVDPHHGEVASANVARAGLSDRVEIRVGRAIDSLPTLRDELARSADGRAFNQAFDMVFIDADKPSTSAYFEHAVEMTRLGGLIVVDNSVRRGRIADPSDSDPNVLGMRNFHDLLAGRSDSDVQATTVQTVGSKGYDGFTLIYVGS